MTHAVCNACNFATRLVPSLVPVLREKGAMSLCCNADMRLEDRPDDPLRAELDALKRRVTALEEKAHDHGR